MKKFSVATHMTETHPVTGAGKVEGMTIEGTYTEVQDGVLTIYKEHGGNKGREAVATFARGHWLHVYDVAASS